MLYGLNLENVRSGADKRSTLMVRNIPNKYSQKLLLEAIETNHRLPTCARKTKPADARARVLCDSRLSGPTLSGGRIDVLYLPIDFKNKCNVGCALDQGHA